MQKQSSSWKLVGHPIFTKSYLGHQSKQVEKH